MQSLAEQLVDRDLPWMRLQSDDKVIWAHSTAPILLTHVTKVQVYQITYRNYQQLPSSNDDEHW
jgi:hypothetical protein